MPIFPSLQAEVEEDDSQGMTVKDAAKRLGVSPRTLHRYLRAEGREIGACINFHGRISSPHDTHEEAHGRNVSLSPVRA